ncbi:hypothetical protein BaRGS_00022480 [Batillaria attramentaria]|uniref:Uncharacterized protein n=1 Tax=Batillaria attramentaria TaxID=370345 RepID=A0ABD0KH65_9CAEN
MTQGIVGDQSARSQTRQLSPGGPGYLLLGNNKKAFEQNWHKNPHRTEARGRYLELSRCNLTSQAPWREYFGLETAWLCCAQVMSKNDVHLGVPSKEFRERRKERADRFRSEENSRAMYRVPQNVTKQAWNGLWRHWGDKQMQSDVPDCETNIFDRNSLAALYSEFKQRAKNQRALLVMSKQYRERRKD